MPFFKKSLAGPGYIVLNVIRVLNIIALLSVTIASFAMLVKTFVVSKFYFFDGVSHFITAVLSILFIITEIGLFRAYTARNWPLLSPSSGFVTLGILMIILGVSVLGNLNKEATSQQSLGTAFWRITIASGIVVSIIGIANIFASYFFRQPALGITARQVRAHGSTAAQKVYVSPSSSIHKPRRSFHLGRSYSETLPSYRTSNTPMPMQQGRNISAPVAGSATMGGEPMSATSQRPPVRFVNGSETVGLQRPDVAVHPALRGSPF